MSDKLKFLGIIPSRFASTRFPGKPLALINGQSMISRVYHQAKKSHLLSEVFVATDDDRIKKHVEDFGGNVIMTSTEHNSGTDRCYEAVSLLHKLDSSLSFDVIINIQGDEPFVDPAQIDLLCNCFSNSETKIATLIKKILTDDELTNPNVVKVITDTSKSALYFSRSVIPFIRGKSQNEWLKSFPYFKHIGIYAYTLNVLETVTKLPQSSLEKAESLEQLRWLENGLNIRTEITDFESYAIDTPEDLLTINQQLLNK